jgi:hypothetical protein
MVWKFYARDGLVREPGRRPVIGQVVSYLGRAFVPPSTDKDGRIVDAAYPATKEPVEWDTSKNEPAHNEHLRRAAVKGAFWPADATTAAAWGLPLVAVEFAEGVWLEKAAAPKRAASAGKAE